MRLTEDVLRAALRATGDEFPAHRLPELMLPGDEMPRDEMPGRRPGDTMAARRWSARSRTGRLVTPLAAAAAVIAVIGAAVGLAAGRSPADHPEPAAPRQFNPLVPFADFGWVPRTPGFAPSTEIVSGQMWRSAEQLLTSADTTLSVYPVGACAWTRQYPVTDRILTCGPGGAEAGGSALIRVSDRAPDINGLSAYWGAGGPLARGGVTNQPVQPMIAFQYARGGWALLHYPLRQYALRMARTVQFRLRAPLRFAAQLRNGLPQWHVILVSFSRSLTSRAGFDGSSLVLADSNQTGLLPLPGAPFLVVSRQPAVGSVSCPFTARSSQSKVINGYRVAVRTARGVPPTGGPPRPYQAVCTSDADGLFVEVSVTGSHPPLTAVQVFGRLKLLGPDPARWTTKPLS
jgi:hypothetical protein